MAKVRKIFTVVLLMAIAVQSLGIQIQATADVQKIELKAEQVKAKAHSQHAASNIVDGVKETYWQSIPSNGEGDDYKRMYDHNRYIDIQLDGVYDLSQIKVFQNVDQKSYNHYYIYTSLDGVNYDKVVAKTDDTKASAQGDTFNVNVKAAYVRLNMAYNSTAFVTNLAELELYGSKSSASVQDPAEIQVSDWQGSKWQKEWDKVASNQAYANAKTVAEMQALVGRVIGNQWKNKFVFEVREDLGKGQDVFEISNASNGRILIRGNNGIAMASGFNYYLKYYLNVDYNPFFESNTAVTSIVPVEKTIIKEAQFDLRYALNFCTYSYTMAFWNWDEYEAFLDWCAMNSINLVLDIVGQEEVLRQTFRQFNFTDEEIKDYIAGPGYFAWFYMQNLYSVGGPLPNAWFEQRVELGRQIHDRMQTYGIQPVLQGFAGQVPETFAQKNEGAVLTPKDGWVGYTRPSIIKTYLTKEEEAAGKKNYFEQAAKTFYDAQKNIFGDITDYYATDPFHEGGNTGGLDIASIFKTVQDEMIKSNPDAIWVMQQWQGNLNHQKMSKMDTSHALALDLQSDMNPQHGLFENNGTPWIYCMLHNFGGRMGLDGEIPVIASDPVVTKNKTRNMKGIGITPEALENSPVVYELFFETNWSKDPIDYNKWVDDYAKRRAGVNEKTDPTAEKELQEAWDILLETAYADKGIYYQGAAETVINARPTDSFNSASTWGHSNILYDKAKLDEALVLLANNYDAFKASPAYRYDLADVAEQVLANAAVEYHKLMVEYKNSKDLVKFEKISNEFLALIDLSDRILSTTEEFMVGTWIEASRKMIVGADDWTKDLFEFNARSLITTWGGERVSGLKDYSNRKWSGLTKDFYKERWAIWIRNRIADMKGQPRNDADAQAERNWFLWEFKWVNRKSDDENGKYAYPTKAVDENLAQLAQEAYDRFSFTNFDKNAGGAVEEKTNVLKGVLATTTSQTKSGNIANITNGVTSDEWILEGEGPHEIVFDLQGKYELNEMTLSFQQLAKQFPYTYKVEALNDGKWTTVKEDNSKALDSNVTIAMDKVKAEQLKVTFTTSDVSNTPVNITEISAYGKALEKVTYTNIAAGIMPETNKTNTDPGFPLSNVTDGNKNNLWKTKDWGNGAYPAYISIPLEAATFVDYLDIYFEKTGLPFKFYVTITDEAGQETIVYDHYRNHDGTMDERSFKINVNKVITKATVHYEGITGKGSAGQAGPALSEFMMMTKGEVVNIAQGLQASADRKTHNDASLSFITDGNMKNLWKTEQWGKASYPTTVTLPLPAVTMVDSIELYFEKAGLPFKFYVAVTDASGNEIIVYDKYKENTNVTEEASYKIPVNKKIQAVKVYFTGTTEKGDAYAASPAIVELKVMSREKVEKGVEINFEEGKIGGVSVAGGNAGQAVLDGDKDRTFSKVDQNKDIVFDLHGDHFVKHVDLTFEKAELGLRYKVFAQDKEGNRTLIKDTTNSKDLLGNKTVRVPVNQIANKIIFVHMGNNGNGPAYLAESRLYEFEAFSGKPEVISTGASINPSDASILVDGKTDQAYRTNENKTFTLTLPEASDVRVVSVEKASDEEKALRYSVEYFDEASQTFKPFVTSTSTKPNSEIFAVAKESVFTNQLRFTFRDDYKLSEIRVFKTDNSFVLANRIAQIREEIATLRYDGSNGSYSPKAKETLEAKLAKAEEALQQGLHSKQVNEWVQSLDQALETFYKEGIVYVNRDALLVNLSKAAAYKKELHALHLFIAEARFEQVYLDARAVYDHYGTTQAMVDEQNKKLEGSLADVEALTTLASFVQTVENFKQEDYQEAQWPAFKTSLEQAQALLETQSATRAAYQEAYTTLTQAEKALKVKTIVPRNMSITLTNQVGLNLYYEINPEILNDEQARVEFSVEDQVGEIQTTSIYVKDFVKVNGLYRVTLPLKARQMTNEVSVKVVTSQGTSTPETYSVASYAQAVLSKPSAVSYEAIAIVEAMLNYGAMAQEYFSYRLDHLANHDILDRSYQSVSPSVFDDFSANVVDGVEGIKYGTSNLRLLSEVAIRHHFVVTDTIKQAYEDGTIQFVSVDEKGQETTLKPTFYDNNKVYVEIENIYAVNLDKMYTVKVKDSANNTETVVEYGVFSYGKVVFEEQAKDETKNIMKAIYVYNQSADAYKSSLNKKK